MDASQLTPMSDRERDLSVQLFEEIDKKLDKMDGRFDKVEARFDKLDDRVSDANTRLTRIEASDIASRMGIVEKQQHEFQNKLTRIETILLPITGAGSALIGALVTWAFGFLPHH